MIGLAGSHRTGKSTLAKRFGEVAGYTYVKTSASKIFEELGLDPKVDYPLSKRLWVQLRLLEDLQQTYEARHNYVVVDRTPIDLMAYTIADVTRQNVDPYADQEIMAYIDKCYAVTRKYFSAIIVLQPGIEVIEEVDKAPGVESYMEHINMLCMGALSMPGMKAVRAYIMSRHCLELDDRVSSMIDIVAALPLPWNVVEVNQRLPM